MSDQSTSEYSPHQQIQARRRRMMRRMMMTMMMMMIMKMKRRRRRRRNVAQPSQSWGLWDLVEI